MNKNKNTRLIWTWHPLYDTCIMPASGAERLYFFSVPLGGMLNDNKSIKTEIVTNLSRPAQIEQPNQFLVQGFATSVEKTTSKQDQESIKSGIFRFVVENKIEFELPMRGIPMNLSEFYMPSFTFFRLNDKLSLLLEGTTAFSVTIDDPEGKQKLPSGKDCPLKLFIIGQYGRSVK